MKIIRQEKIPSNTGRAYIVEKGQGIRISGKTIVDFVAFAYPNVHERFDQARTKAYNKNIFISSGDFLISKLRNKMLKIVEDTYKEGTHDLQRGTCSGMGWKELAKGGADPLTLYPQRGLPYFPDHGCWENLSAALKPWNIRPEDIPSPFNIFMTLEIDGRTGAMRDTIIRPSQTAYVDMVAEMDCLLGVSACPDMQVRGRDIEVLIYQAN